MFGAATAAGSAVAATPPQTAGADPSATTHVVNDQEVLQRLLDRRRTLQCGLANVEGAFAFNQEGTTPNDELFNVFGHGRSRPVLQARRSSWPNPKAAVATST